MENTDRIQEELQKYRSPGQELTIILIRFLAVFLIIFLLAAAFVFYKSHFIKQAYKAVEKVNAVAKVIPIPTKEKYVFLLLGTDMLIDVNRTDSMILVMLSVPDCRIDIISLPRDAKVEIPGHGSQKMNSVYTFEFVKTKSDIASIKKVVSRIEEMSALKIDYYVKVDLKGFEKIIDLFGGVEVDVEKNMTYDDNKQDLHIRLKKGLQVLNGKLGLQYCRFRHDRLGDIGRMQRQQKFLKALVNRAKEGKTLMRLPEIISGSLSFVTTNVDLSLLVALLGAIPEPSKLQIFSHSMPGDFSENEPVCYFLPEIDKYKKLVKDIASGDIVKIEAEKALQEANKAAARLEAENNKKGALNKKNAETRPPAETQKEHEIKKENDIKKDAEIPKTVENKQTGPPVKEPEAKQATPAKDAGSGQAVKPVKEPDAKQAVKPSKGPEPKPAAVNVKDAPVKKQAVKKEVENKKPVVKGKETAKDKSKKTEGTKAAKSDAPKAADKKAASKKTPAGKNTAAESVVITVGTSEVGAKPAVEEEKAEKEMPSVEIENEPAAVEEPIKAAPVEVKAETEAVESEKATEPVKTEKETVAVKPEDEPAAVEVEKVTEPKNN